MSLHAAHRVGAQSDPRRDPLDDPHDASLREISAAGPARLFPGLAQSLLLLAAAAGSYALVTPLLIAVGFETLRTPAASGIANVLVLGVWILLGARWAGSFSEVAALRPVALRHLAPMGIAVLGAVLVASELDNALRALVGPPPAAFDLRPWFEEGLASLPFLVATVLIVAPLTEELLFRGLILRGLLSRYPVWVALLLSALLFALFHANPWQLSAALVAGLLFGWWYVETRSLVPCLLGHAAFNALPLLALLVLPGMPAVTAVVEAAPVASAPVRFQPLWLDALGVALLALGVVTLRRQFADERGRYARRVPQMPEPSAS